MAGDWIKMRADLPNDPAVYKLAAITKTDRFTVVGRLYAFWSWVDKHAVDGLVDGATSHVVDDITSCSGFAEALVAVKWLVIGDDCIEIPHYDRHNGESAKERGLKNARQARWRANKDAAVDSPVGGEASTSASTREEKRREELTTPSLRSGARATRKCPESFEVTFELQDWARSEAPGVDLKRETDKFRDHTFKAAHSDWPGAWRNWIRRTAESKTTNKSAPQGRHTAAAAAIFDMDNQGAFNA